MTDETQLEGSIALLYEQREEALADRRRLEQELGAALSTIEGMRRAMEASRAKADALHEALSNLLRMTAGYSVDTQEVGFCTVADHDRRWIDEARRALGLSKEDTHAPQPK